MNGDVVVVRKEMSSARAAETKVIMIRRRQVKEVLFSKEEGRRRYARERVKSALAIFSAFFYVP
jgi:hypothetical protein